MFPLQAATSAKCDGCCPEAEGCVAHTGSASTKDLVDTGIYIYNLL